MHNLVWVGEMSHLEALALPCSPSAPRAVDQPQPNEAVSVPLVKGHFDIKAVVYQKHWCHWASGVPSLESAPAWGGGSFSWTSVIWDFNHPAVF